ncbi:hypothetical protein ACLOJK_012784 [Asimina triloba]
MKQVFRELKVQVNYTNLDECRGARLIHFIRRGFAALETVHLAIHVSLLTAGRSSVVVQAVGKEENRI